MGGNAFQDLEKLTPEEYESITKELLGVISPMCQRIEPYIPLPEKKVHGDIDFLILFKEGFNLKHIIEILKLQKAEYILNNNLTANTVFRKKQVDFNMVRDQHEFQLCRFYKSYGGIGAFLGLLLPSKVVKFSEEGIFCLWHEAHHKLEFNVCDNVCQILKFYGLDPQRYAAGFRTQQQIFEFLLKTRFLSPQEFKSKKPKWTTKLINGFTQFLCNNPEAVNIAYQKWEDPLNMTLKYFQKEELFQKAWQAKLEFESSKKARSNKWNGKHIIEVFGVEMRCVNTFKKQFEASLGGKQAMETFVDGHSFQEIVAAFSSICGLQPIAK